MGRTQGNYRIGDAAQQRTAQYTPIRPLCTPIQLQNWRLRNKQAAAMKEAEGKNHIAFPMNYSQVEGESGGGKKRKTRRYRKHRK